MVKQARRKNSIHLKEKTPVSPKSHIHKTWQLLAATAVAALAVAACSSGSNNNSGGAASAGSGSSSGTAGSSGGGSAGGALKVALILDGSANDGDYNQEGYQNFQSAIGSFGSKVVSTVKQNVPESPQAAQVVQNLIAQGYRLFFINGTGYETYMQPIAQSHPDIRIEEFESAVTGNNYGAYNINIADSAYIGGMMLAAASKSGHLGIVASFPFPGILTQINGVELGARAVNPNATLHALFVSSFYDPGKERQAAQALISGGADGIVDIQNDATVCQTAQTDGVPCVGQTLINGPSYGPNTYLSDFRFIWTPIYHQVISDTLNKTPVPQSIFAGYPEGATGMGPLGPAYSKDVSPSVQSQITTKEAALKAGSFHVYTGPISDQQGQVKVPSGQTLGANQILSINWAVQGVIGNISKS
jgi:basic membrane protein A